MAPRVAAPVFRRAARVTAVSGFLAADLKRRLPDGVPDVIITPMPIDVAAFAEGGDRRKAAPPRILYAGNLVPSKGVDVLLQAAADSSPRRGFSAQDSGPGSRRAGPPLPSRPARTGLARDLGSRSFLNLRCRRIRGQHRDCTPEPRQGRGPGTDPGGGIAGRLRRRRHARRRDSRGGASRRDRTLGSRRRCNGSGAPAPSLAPGRRSARPPRRAGKEHVTRTFSSEAAVGRFVETSIMPSLAISRTTDPRRLGRLCQSSRLVLSPAAVAGVLARHVRSALGIFLGARRRRPPGAARRRRGAWRCSAPGAW